MKYRKHIAVPFITGLLIASAGPTMAADEGRMKALEDQLASLTEEIEAIKGGQQDLSVLEETASKFRFGGYGDVHANFEEDGGPDQFDIHRLVFYVGYDFTDWIKLTSELELEHAFVSDGNGDFYLEQLYADFLFGDAFNVRAGRVLAPMGIVNQHHEPTLFLGVERPNVDKNIIPSTWSLDGIGLFGSPLTWLSYEAYVVGGLDGSGFRDKDGVRAGRIKERSDLGDPAVVGRVDLYPIVTADRTLRIGLSGYHGGTDNANEGGGNGVDNTFSMVSADFEYDFSRFQFSGVVAHGEHSDAEDLQDAFGNNPGEEIFGWYLEGGVSVMPESWKKGKMAEADLVPFVRYEQYDTHYAVPENVVEDDAQDRTEITVGVNFLLSSQFVLKADYQFVRNEEVGSDAANRFNLGMGWVFQ